MKMKSFTVPTKAYSASLHPSRSYFVVGGEDFKIYKFDYSTAKELGKPELVRSIVNNVQFFRIL